VQTDRPDFPSSGKLFGFRIFKKILNKTLNLDYYANNFGWLLGCPPPRSMPLSRRLVVKDPRWNLIPKAQEKKIC